MFEFKMLDRLNDKEIELRITEKILANPKKGYVPAYKYHIFLLNTDIQIGYIDIRIGHNENLYYGGNIGYAIHESYRGHHYAQKACQLIIEVAKAHNMDYLYITCDPNNLASKKTLENLGLEFIEIALLPEHNNQYQEGDREKCIFKWKIGK